MDNLLTSLLLSGPLDAATLQSRLNISQATLSRLCSRTAGVLKYGRARATRYALLRPLREVSQFPLWRVNEHGQATPAGQLYSIWPAGSCVVEDELGKWQHFSGLPWYLSDMRPQGFLGRAWGREHAQALGLPEDIRQWSDDHTLLALSHYGVDITGSWLIGRQSYQQWLQRPAAQALPLADKAAAYPQLASRALAGEEAGSSAGGEQPKFSHYVALRGGGAGYALVKFTPRVRNENSLRWADLLRAEHLALNTLQQYGLAAAGSELIVADGGQLFLEVKRFDRLEAFGRRSMVSLEAVQAEFIGQQQPWPAALQELLRQKRISREDAARGTLQWAFGRLIANGDMHSGNLSFFLQDEQLLLTPAYDMLPMSFAPNSAGHMRHQAPQIGLDFTVGQRPWQQAMQMAQAYWQSVQDDLHFSEDFRQLAAGMQQRLVELCGQIARMA